jgi:hypothetical protein
MRPRFVVCNVRDAFGIKAIAIRNRQPCEKFCCGQPANLRNLMIRYFATWMLFTAQHLLGMKPSTATVAASGGCTYSIDSLQTGAADFLPGLFRNFMSVERFAYFFANLGARRRSVLLRLAHFELRFFRVLVSSAKGIASDELMKISKITLFRLSARLPFPGYAHVATSLRAKRLAHSRYAHLMPRFRAGIQRSVSTVRKITECSRSKITATIERDKLLFFRIAFVGVGKFHHYLNVVAAALIHNRMPHCIAMSVVEGTTVSLSSADAALPNIKHFILVWPNMAVNIVNRQGVLRRGHGALTMMFSQ